MEIDRTVSRLIELTLNMWRFRWMALATAWLLALAGWAWVFLQPSVYETDAKVFVNTDTVLRPLMEGLAAPMDTTSQVSLVTRAMLSRPQLENVASVTGLGARAKDPEGLQHLVEGLRRQIQITKAPGEQVYSISYRDHDPNMAYDVVAILLNNFMEKALGAGRTDSAQAQRFLEAQIKAYETRLNEAEERLAAFKQQNIGLMPGTGGGYYENMQKAQTDVQALQERMEALEERRNELQRQLAGEEPTFGMGAEEQGGGRRSSVDSAIANLERQLSELRLKLTDKHPDVVRVQETLKDLYRMRDEEQRSTTGDLSSASSFSTLKFNPVYQAMRMSLSATEADLAGVRAQLKEKQQTSAALKKMINTMPDVEAQLNRLNRDYSVVKTEYETLLKRLESARLGEQVQENTGDVKFKVIEPPRIPLQPSAPNKPMLYALAFLAALAGAGGIAFVLGQNDPAFFSGLALRDATTLPIYGVLGLASTGRAVRKSWLFEIGMAGLVVMFVVVFVTANSLSAALGKP